MIDKRYLQLNARVGGTDGRSNKGKSFNGKNEVAGTMIDYCSRNNCDTSSVTLYSQYV